MRTEVSITFRISALLKLRRWSNGIVGPTGSPLPGPDSSQSSPYRGSVLIQRLQTSPHCYPTRRSKFWCAEIAAFFGGVLPHELGRELLGRRSLALRHDLPGCPGHFSALVGPDPADRFSPTGSTPISRTVVKELQPSDLAWQPFAASSDCSVARCSQTHPLVLHPVTHCERQARFSAGANMGPHAKVPLLALLAWMHLRVTLTAGVLSSCARQQAWHPPP